MSEDEPHRPPKYVDGHYKPHFGDPDADYAIMVASSIGGDMKLYLGTTDSTGDAAGVIRRLDNGKPMYEGADSVAGHVYDSEIELSEFWSSRVKKEDVKRVLEDE